ncbi:MAG: hypothetical protein GTO03_03885 [Planctomycetales bacterium]|nr:hypothetical protein [Planctomycetales bacterium]
MADDFDPYFKWLGIPPDKQPPNHYQLLGVPIFTDDPDVISNAFDRHMAHLRTFQSGPQAAHSQKLLNEISAARGCLLNPTRKAEYDARLRSEMEARPQPDEDAPQNLGPSAKTQPPLPPLTSMPTNPFQSPEPPQETEDTSTGSSIQLSGNPTATRRIKNRRRKKKNNSILAIWIGLFAVLLLGIVLYKVLSNPGDGGLSIPIPSTSGKQTQPPGK